VLRIGVPEQSVLEVHPENMDGHRNARNSEREEQHTYPIAYYYGDINGLEYQHMIPPNMSMRYRKGLRYFLTSANMLRYVQNMLVSEATFDLAHEGFKQFYCKEYDEILIYRKGAIVAGYVREGTSEEGDIKRLPEECREHVFNPKVDTDETWEPSCPTIKIVTTRKMSNKILVYYDISSCRLVAR